MKLNAPENCEVIIITLDKVTTPIAYANRIQSLINSGLSEKEANSEMLNNPTIEMEIYYDVNTSCFLVDSLAIESTEIYNPYTGEELEIEVEEN